MTRGRGFFSYVEQTLLDRAVRGYSIRFGTCRLSIVAKTIKKSQGLLTPERYLVTYQPNRRFAEALNVLSKPPSSHGA